MVGTEYYRTCARLGNVGAATMYLGDLQSRDVKGADDQAAARISTMREVTTVR